MGSESENRKSWRQTVASAVRGACYIFLGMIVFQILLAVWAGTFELSIRFMLEVCGTILEDILLGHAREFLFTALAYVTVLIAMLLWAVLREGLPVWLYLLRVATLFSVIFALSFAAHEVQEHLPDWAISVLGVAIWAAVFFIAAKLGFSGARIARDSDKYLY